MKYQILKGSVDVSIDLFIQDSSLTTGAGLTGLVYNSAGLTCYYHRPGSNSAQLSLATQTVTGAHADGGFKEIDATNMPGWYRLDLSDAVIASGVNFVGVHLKGATNMAPLPLEIELVAYNPQDAVRLGLTALPNAAAEASGGLAVLSAAQASNGTIPANVHRWLTGTPNALQSGRVDSYVGAVAAGVIASGSFAAGAFDAVWTVTTRELTAFSSSFKTGYALSSAGVQAIWDALTSALTTVGSIGKLLVDNINATISSRASQATADAIETDTQDIQARLPAALVSGRMDSSVGAMQNDTLTAAALAASAVAEIQSGLSTLDSGDIPSPAQIADAVWDEAVSDHVSAGSTGERVERLDIIAAGGSGGLTNARAAALDNLDAAVSTRLPTSGYTSPLDAAGTRSAIGLASANLDTQLGALPTANENADALLDRTDGVETSRTLRQSLRLMLASLAGKFSGAGTTEAKIRDTNDTKDRITATVDEDGNRTAVTYDAD